MDPIVSFASPAMTALQVGSIIGLSTAVDREFRSFSRLRVASGVGLVGVGLRLWAHRSLRKEDPTRLAQEVGIDLATAGITMFLAVGKRSLAVGAMIATVSEFCRRYWVYRADVPTSLHAGLVALFFGFGAGHLFHFGAQQILQRGKVLAIKDASTLGPMIQRASLVAEGTTCQRIYAEVGSAHTNAALTQAMDRILTNLRAERDSIRRITFLHSDGRHVCLRADFDNSPLCNDTEAGILENALGWLRRNGERPPNLMEIYLRTGNRLSPDLAVHAADLPGGLTRIYLELRQGLSQGLFSAERLKAMLDLTGREVPTIPLQEFLRDRTG